MLALGASGATRESSSLSSGTKAIETKFDLSSSIKARAGSDPALALPSAIFNAQQGRFAKSPVKVKQFINVSSL